MLGVIHSLTPRTANHYTIKTSKRQVNFRYFFWAAGISLVLAEKARKIRIFSFTNGPYWAFVQVHSTCYCVFAENITYGRRRRIRENLNSSLTNRTYMSIIKCFEVVGSERGIVGTAKTEKTTAAKQGPPSGRRDFWHF